MRKRISYANVAATLALVLSMSGGALAANQYLVSSTKQISPKVLKKLKGRAGKTGKNGLTGKEGAVGKEGPVGKEGSQGKEGAAGTAVAYAHILGSSSPSTLLDSANSKNIASVTQPFPGGYCIATTVPIKNVSGAVADFNGGGPDIVVTADFSEVPTTIGTKQCQAGTTVLVETSNGKEDEFEAADFWISFN